MTEGSRPHRVHGVRAWTARAVAAAHAAVLLSPLCAQAQPSQCWSDRARYVVGHAYTRDLAEEARIAAGAETVRKLEPAQVHTTEFRRHRLNVFVDPFGKVTGVRCG